MSSSETVNSAVKLVDTVQERFRAVAERAKAPSGLGESDSEQNRYVEQKGAVSRVQVGNSSSLHNIEAALREVTKKHVPNLKASIESAANGVGVKDISEIQRLLNVLKICKARMLATINSRYDVGHPYLKEAGEIPEDVQASVSDLEASLDQLGQAIVLKL